MQIDLSKYNNDHYQPGIVVKRCAWYIINLLFFNNGLFPFYGAKVSLLRLFGARVGTGVLIKPYVNIKYPWFLSIGNNCWIGEKVWIDNLGKISIGNNVCISQGALLLSGNHDYRVDTFDLIIKPIIIEDGVWIGARAIVPGGVTCGSQSVLAVNSVASVDLESHGIYKGNPAVKIKDRS